MSALLGYEDKPFVEFLKSKKLTDTIRHYVQHAIAMVTDSATTIQVTLPELFSLSLSPSVLTAIFQVNLS